MSSSSSLLPTVLFLATPISLLAYSYYGFNKILFTSSATKTENNDNQIQEWNPPQKIEELFAKTANNKFASINSPVAGARTQKSLSIGNSSLQLYSLATPNGQKVSIFLEELGVDYDAHTINIGVGDQFTSGFVEINPNSKIPALMDHNGPNNKPIRLFESASIILYLAEKYGKFIPSDPAAKVEVMNWVFWQMGGLGPMCGNFGHFMAYAPSDKVETRDYGVARYGMEVQRLFSVLDQRLANNKYVVGNEITIADFIIFPWIYHFKNNGYPHSSGINGAKLLSFEKYTNIQRWVDEVYARPAVQRGLQVNKWGSDKPKPWLP
eukprot:gene9069-12231_t